MFGGTVAWPIPDPHSLPDRPGGVKSQRPNIGFFALRRGVTSWRHLRQGFPGPFQQKKTRRGTCPDSGIAGFGDSGTWTQCVWVCVVWVCVWGGGDGALTQVPGRQALLFNSSREQKGEGVSPGNYSPGAVAQSRVHRPLGELFPVCPLAMAGQIAPWRAQTPFPPPAASLCTLSAELCVPRTPTRGGGGGASRMRAGAA